MSKNNSEHKNFSNNQQATLYHFILSHSQCESRQNRVSLKNPLIAKREQKTQQLTVNLGWVNWLLLNPNLKVAAGTNRHRANRGLFSPTADRRQWVYLFFLAKRSRIFYRLPSFCGIYIVRARGIGSVGDWTRPDWTRYS